MSTPLPRREFVRNAAVAVSSLALSGPASTAYAADPQPWFDRPMRWAQLTLVENDPGQYDPKFWLDYFRRTHSDAACLSAGGCVAYYPDARSRCTTAASGWATRDPFGELVAGCRKLNMVVMARTDPHAVHQDVYDAHPDWIAVDAQGNRRRHWAMPELWVTCALGPYNFEFMTGVTREIVANYQVDGIFSNRWAGSGMCYCEHCRENFRTASGLELPRTLNPQDPARSAYIVWQQQRLFELWHVWDAEIRKINPAARYIANAGRRRPQRSRHEDHRRARAHAVRRSPGAQRPRRAVGQRQERQGIPRHHGEASRSAASSAWASKSPIAGRIPCRTAPRCGCGCSTASPTACVPGSRKFCGTLYDERWLPVVEELYAWHYRNEQLPAQRGAAGARGDGLLAADRAVLRRRARAAEGRRPHAGLLPGADRSAHPVRDGARSPARRRTPGALQGPDPAEHRCAVRRAVPTDSRLRGARRRHRGDP